MTSWLEISEERLRANYAAIAGAVGPEVSVLAVVKANAYGHGVEQSARALAGAGELSFGRRWLGGTSLGEISPGGMWFGVTGVEEGRRVRRVVGAEPRVLVMCGISEEDAEAVLAEDLTPVIWTAEQAGWLAAAAERVGKGASVHLEVDSGMTRQGVRAGAELLAVVTAIKESKGVRLEGVMTHFASAEVAGSRQGRQQRRVFEQALREIAEAGVVLEWVHAGNTSGVDLVEGSSVDLGADSTEDLVGDLVVGDEDFVAWVGRMARQMGARAMVRSGLGLYGYSLEFDGGGVSGLQVSGLEASGLQGSGLPGSRLPGLEPVMTWKAKVLGVEDVPAGVAVGYNGTFVTERPMRLALVGVGYADGLRRELSSTNAKAGGWMMVRGERAAIVGRISMNLTTVDVSGIGGVGGGVGGGVVVGDEAVVLGEGCTAEDHARLAGTIAYEILCGVRAMGRSGE